MLRDFVHGPRWRFVVFRQRQSGGRRMQAMASGEGNDRRHRGTLAENHVLVHCACGCDNRWESFRFHCSVTTRTDLLFCFVRVCCFGLFRICCFCVVSGSLNACALPNAHWVGVSVVRFWAACSMITQVGIIDK